MSRGQKEKAAPIGELAAGASRLDRRAAVAALLRDRSNAVVVSGLGSPTYDVAAAGDHDRNFYLWGAMGGAAMTGLGLALAQPDVPVIVVTGDGEMLMGLGAFATIAVQVPGNLTICVLDNGRYGETGGQRTHSDETAPIHADIAGIARACGIADARTISDTDELDNLARRAHDISSGPCVGVLKVARNNLPRVMPIRDGAFNKARLRLALGLPSE